MSQEFTLDSIYNLPFEELDFQFRKLSKENQIYLAEEFLLKAKKQKDSVKIINGLFLKLFEHSHSPQSIIYLDSIQEFAVKWNRKYFIGFGYLEKGIQLYYLGQYEEALDLYLKSLIYFENQKDEYNILRVKHYVALLKNVTDQHVEANKTFKANMLFFNDKNKEKYQEQYFKSLFALADSYNRNQKYDLAAEINKTGIRESKIKKSNMYPHFLLSFGTSKILNNQPKIGIDSIIKGTGLIQHKKAALCASYIKLSKGYLKLDKFKAAETYLMKVDSIYKEDNSVILYANKAYTSLYKLFSKQGEIEKQIQLIDKLLAIDSLLKSREKRLSSRIIKEYETPKLLSKRDELIDSLNRKSSNYQKYNYILFSISGLLLLVTIFIIKVRRNKRYIFNQLIQKDQKKIDRKTRKRVEHKKDIGLGISIEIIESISNKLIAFEKSNLFVKKQYTLTSLAKKLKTNSSYLSKIINHKMGVNFSTYLNELKVNYIIEELKTNPKYLKYSIEGIATVGGFNSTESFNAAFYKKTGIYPRYFIKQLEKDKN